MKISIVTISYNQKEFLRQCMDSVLNQDYSNIEYIVVDPGSTDGSREIIDSFGDRIIKVYEKDNGPADGLNKGFEHATGDIFCYLNSDDVFLSNAFSRICEYFEVHAEVDVVCGHAQIIDADSVVKRSVYSDPFSLSAAAYGAAISIQPSTFFRPEIFKKAGGFNVNNRSNWDGELIIDMALAGAKIKVIDEVLSCYRVHGDSITGTGRLAEMHEDYGQRMFEKIMGRSFQRSDDWVKNLYRLRKHLLSPRGTLERIFRGPVFGTEK